MLFSEDLNKFRNKAMIRIIDLTSEKITILNDLKNTRSEKKIDELNQKLLTIENSIRNNRNIIFNIGDMDKEISLEQ